MRWLRDVNAANWIFQPLSQLFEVEVQGLEIAYEARDAGVDLCNFTCVEVMAVKVADATVDEFGEEDPVPDCAPYGYSAAQGIRVDLAATSCVDNDCACGVSEDVEDGEVEAAGAEGPLGDVAVCGFEVG